MQRSAHLPAKAITGNDHVIASMPAIDSSEPLTVDAILAAA